MSGLGWLHFLLSLLAIALGSFVLASRKGTGRHRRIGRLFVWSMLILSIAALFIYNINGGWTMFHWLAVMSLSLLAIGMIPLYLRRPRNRWLMLHSSGMVGAYIGLVTAGVAQITGRLTADSGRLGVWATMAVIFAVGGYLSAKYIPQAIENLGSGERSPASITSSD